MSFTIKRAQRSQAKLRLAMAAVSGAGKTMGALRVAKGLVQMLIDTGQLEGGIEGKICLVDSERKSAQLYAHVVPFDTIELEPPYSVDRYQQALQEVEQAGYVICIIDQISHAWAGPGGQLEFIDTLKAQSKNAISPWAKVTPMQQEFYDRMLRSGMHLILTMRAKSEWVIDDVVVDGGRTKKVPRKIGLSPVQREGIEYEFTTMLDIELESHLATSSKDRTGLFADRVVKLDEDCGRRLGEWLMTGEKPAQPIGAAAPKAADAEKATEALKELTTKLEKGFTECATLPDLAAQFDQGQKDVKAYAPVLGAEVVRPYLERLVTAKDARKTAIANPPANAGAQQAQPPAKRAGKREAVV